MDLRVTDWHHSDVVYNCTGHDVRATDRHGSHIVFPVNYETTFNVSSLYPVRPEQFYGAAIKVVVNVALPERFVQLIERANLEQAVLLVDFATALTIRRMDPNFQGMLLVPVREGFVQY